MGIIIAFVSLAVGDFGQSRRIENSARQLAKLIEVAEQEAILVPNIMGLRIDKEGYQFYHFLLDPKHPRGRWVALTRDTVFRARRFPKRTTIKLSTGSDPMRGLSSVGSHRPQIIITTTGDLTPFTLWIGTEGGKPSIRLTASFDGDVTVQRETKE